MKSSKSFIFFFLFLINTFTALAQETVNVEIQDDPKREEIQRYFGYENLLVRYLTAPYDLTMNINERGNFLDIGFLYFLLLPLLLLFYYYRNKWFAVLWMMTLFLVMVISTSNSHIFVRKNSTFLENKAGSFIKTPDLSISDGLIPYFLTKYYAFNNVIYKPLNTLFDSISGQQDFITYPFLILLFILGSFLIFSRFKDLGSNYLKVIVSLLWTYIFLWFLLSSGIIWYGYLMLLMGLFLIIILLNRIEENKAGPKWIKKCFYGFATIWVLLAFTNRISSINITTPTEHQGKNLFNPVFYRYANGFYDITESTEALNPGLSKALEHINSNESLVYRVGTSHTYFIDNNHKRVFLDNQLGFFNNLANKYRDKNVIAEVLKAADFKYLIIDLYTPTIDRTPERSLIQKFNLFMNFCHQNQHLKLIGTDRVIKLEDGKNYNGVFGEIISHGSYAIFEII